jgi:hypothetical protein
MTVKGRQEFDRQRLDVTAVPRHGEGLAVMLFHDAAPDGVNGTHGCCVAQRSRRTCSAGLSSRSPT